MGIVTVTKLENADKDADSLNTFINGSDTAKVKTRTNKEYPTLANAVRQVMETGGWEPFATESALLASRPTITKKAAKALDTKKVWLWDGTQWNDTGLSEKDLAIAHSDAEIAKTNLNVNTKLNVAYDFYSYQLLPSFFYLNENNQVIKVSEQKDFSDSIEGLESEFQEINKELSSKVSFSVDFRTFESAKLPSFFYINENKQVIDLKPSAEAYKFEFYTFNENKPRILMLTGDYKVINPETELPEQEIDLKVFTDLGRSKYLATDEPHYYRDGEKIKQYDTKYPEYYDLAYADLNVDPEAIYARFDAMMLTHTNMTKKEIGRSVNNIPIYEYTIATPPRRKSDGMPSWQVASPKICIQGCMHGNEYAGTVGLLVFIDKLLNRWRELDGYDVLRFGCQFVIVPCVNPDGMRANTRQNANGCDLNRNFEGGWTLKGSPGFTMDNADRWSGAAPLDQPETQIISAWYQSHSNAVLFVDLHAHGESELLWLGTNRPETLGIAVAVGDKITTYAHKHLTPYTSKETAQMIWIATNGDATGANYVQSVLGKNCILIESPWAAHPKLKGTNYQLRELTSTAILETALIAFNKENLRRINNFTQV